jgi:molecular chaperone Hsp33
MAGERNGVGGKARLTRAGFRVGLARCSSKKKPGPLVGLRAAMNSDDEQPQGLEVRTYFVRNRNALVARADFGELYVDYYLHQSQFGLRHGPADDEMLKDALAAVTLHAASRPWNEITAWTIHFVNPLVNVFVTGDSQRGTVVGQIFTEDVKEDGRSLFMSDVVRGNSPARRSVVELPDNEIFPAVEHYYGQSEQLPARLFRHSEEDFVLVSAHPDCDMQWFDALDDDAIRTLDQTEELSLLERRFYRWECGCNEGRMMDMLAPVMRRDAAALFGDGPAIRMSCPRCGARYTISRDAMEAHVKGA